MRGLYAARRHEIADKAALFPGRARPEAGVVVRNLRCDAYRRGELSYPVPWATAAAIGAVAAPEVYRRALRGGGYELVSERNRREFALAYFAGVKAFGGDAEPPLGLHTLMGDRRKAQVRNMIENISNGTIAPFELVAKKRIPDEVGGVCVWPKADIAATSSPVQTNRPATW